MNNRGQSLVLFVLCLPILLLIFAFVINYGKMSLIKNELNNINYLVIDTYLDNINDDNILVDIQELVLKNDNDCNVDVLIKDDKLYVELTKEFNSIIPILEDSYMIESTYVGYINESGKRIIERDK